MTDAEVGGKKVAETVTSSNRTEAPLNATGASTHTAHENKEVTQEPKGPQITSLQLNSLLSHCEELKLSNGLSGSLEE